MGRERERNLDKFVRIGTSWDIERDPMNKQETKRMREHEKKRESESKRERH